METKSRYSGLQALPCVWMRGGTSKAAFFHAADLPTDPAARDRLLLAAMDGTDARQIDGIGGGHPLTTKIAIISRSSRDDADIDYLFGQLVIAAQRIDYAPTCGNILAAVAPFALEEGLLPCADGETRVRIHMVNTKSLCEAVLPTPGGKVSYQGTTRISGVPGSAAAIELRFADVAGSSCGALYPTGQAQDVVNGVAVSCIDNGMPVVLLRAADLGITGYESPAELDANDSFKRELEAIRLAIGPRMGLGDVSERVVPKMTLLAAPINGGAIHTRTFIPKKCHDAIGVLGAASVATGCANPATVAGDLVALNEGSAAISVEHPTGEFTIRLTAQADAAPAVALIRTARPLFRGQVLLPYPA
ncbi:4-oxalomesaconate tautomerase [Aquitalea magnusonii]|uniref:4-oxalomesaconate tautomerase n=1 Tax=Aquitalea magnusonii TaxID=332411 RepID=A0A318IWU8_9NEIS|nr:4-oxalomesaconate tautomerase [Aquitalea magnusonii]PXX38841.1 4-oxalomesaconate tautomerase [Aquitalea magnusonii]